MSDTNATASWNSQISVEYYQIILTEIRGNSEFNVTGTGNSNQTSTVFTNLEYGEQYNLVVCANNAAGRSCSNPVEFVVGKHQPTKLLSLSLFFNF